MRNDKTYEYIEDRDEYKNSNTTDLGFEDDFADDPDVGVYEHVKGYRTLESKDLYPRDDWMMKRDRLLINLKHELKLCELDSEEEKKKYLKYWGNPNSLNKDQFIEWYAAEEQIGKDNTYGGRRIVKPCIYTRQERKHSPFNYVLKEEVRKEIRKKYNLVEIKEDGKTVIFREYNLEEDGKRKKHPYTFKFVENLESKITNVGIEGFNKEDNKFYFSDNTEHTFNEVEDYKTTERVFEEAEYQLDNKDEKKPAYKTVIDVTKPNRGIQGYEIELMYGYMSLMGRDPDLGRKKVNGEWKYYHLMKEVWNEGKLISSDKKWNNRSLRKAVKDGEGNIKHIPFQPEELKSCIEKCISIYEGENKKERFTNLIDVMKTERAEAKARANALNEVSSNEESTVSE